MKTHRAIAFESSNSKIATIGKKGTIKGIGKKTMYRLRLPQNGVMKAIKVTVK